MIISTWEQSIETTSQMAIEDVTESIDYLDNLDIDNGLLFGHLQHTTASLTIQEHEPRLLADILDFLETLVPSGGDYHHDDIDNNADAHIRSAFFGPSITVPIVDASPSLGRWQSILLIEGDGPRRRTITWMAIGQ